MTSPYVLYSLSNLDYKWFLYVTLTGMCDGIWTFILFISRNECTTSCEIKTQTALLRWTHEGPSEVIECWRVFLGSTCYGETGANIFKYTMLLNANCPRKLQIICLCGKNDCDMNDDDDDATRLLLQYCALFPNSNLKQTVRRFPILHVVNSFGIIYASKKQTTSNYTLKLTP